jgi:phage tail-like protein
VSFGITVNSLASLNVSVGVEAQVGFSVSSGPPMQLGERQDPFPNFNFAVEIEGMVHAGFSEVSGLQLEIEVQEYREGGVNQFMHKRAGPAKYPSNLTLKKGITVVRELWDWYWQVTQGNIERRNLSVLLMDSTGEEQRRWNFEQAYPVKWVGPELRASANEAAFESLEFAHKGLSKA